MRIKRLFDLIAGSVIAVVAAPLLAGAAAWVRLTMGPPVLFRQQRPGLNGESFTLYKLRTMPPSSRPDATDGERLTRTGCLLRSTSLDELPELWNVLRGDMSLVGPRPLLVEYMPLYSERQARRHEVRPGITGLAQVLDRNETTWERRLALDVWYVDHRSVWLDLKILFMTVGRVLSMSGVSAKGEATMPKFEGTPDG